MSFALSFYGLGGAIQSPDMLPLLIGPPGQGAGDIPGGIDNSLLSDMATATFKGRIAAGDGPPQDLTATQATSLLNVATASLKGLMSASDFAKLAGTAAVVNGGTGAVSLTSGALLKGNGTSPVTASVVTDDGTNVGIGRAAPANKLDVNGSLTVADSAFVYTPYNGATTNTGTVRAGIQVDGTSQTLNFYTSNSFRGGVDQTGNVYAGGGATAMTDGFFYIPAAAGAPTGVPTAKADRVPMYYDTTNNNFYVYNGAWKKVLLT